MRIKLSYIMVPAPHDTFPLGTTQTTHNTLEIDSETAARYSEDTNPQWDIAQLQEHFQQFRKDLINYDLPPTHPHTLGS